MNRFLLIAWIAASGWAVAQDVARAAPPSAEALWALLGNVSTIDVEVVSPDVENMRIVTMYQGRAVVTVSNGVDPEDAPVVTVSAGALGPGVGQRPCEGGVLAFIHHRVVRNGGAGGFGGGMSQSCVPVDDVVAVWDHGGAAPLNRPPEFHQEHPRSIPVDIWLLFGATDLVLAGGPSMAEGIDDAFAHYFMLSTEFITPPPDQWELPAYETWRDAYDAFGER